MNLNSEIPAAAEPPAIDPESLAELRGLPDEDGGELLNQLVEMFLEDAPQTLTDLRAALAADDAPAVARFAHTVKGAGGYFGAHRFQKICGAIEMAGKAGDLAPVSDLLTTATGELRRVVTALEAQLQLPHP